MLVNETALDAQTKGFTNALLLGNFLVFLPNSARQLDSMLDCSQAEVVLLLHFEGLAVFESVVNPTRKFLRIDEALVCDLALNDWLELRHLEFNSVVI